MGTLLGGIEKPLFDNIALEVVTLAGTDSPILWKFAERVGNAVSGYIDCLYEEPGFGSKHYIPFRVLCYFEAKDRTTEVGDDGMVGSTAGRITFVRKNLETARVPMDENANHISEGDIIQLWSQNRLRTWYFDIINVNRDGWQNDSDNYTLYVADVVRNDSFIPERKIVK